MPLVRPRLPTTPFGWTLLAAAIAVGVSALSLEGEPLWWALGVTVTLFTAITLCGSLFSAWRFFCPAHCHGKPGSMRVALTFDDGPDPRSTPPLLDLLRREEVSACFFCIGRHAEAHPDIVRRIAREGHIVGNHTQDHVWWNVFLLGPALSRQIDNAQRVLTPLVGAAPRFFRSPQGFTNADFGKILRRRGMELIGFRFRGCDLRAPPERTIARMLSRARDGSIIPLHDAGTDPASLVARVEGIIRGLRERGFSIVRLDALLDVPAYQQAPTPNPEVEECASQKVTLPAPESLLR